MASESYLWDGCEPFEGFDVIARRVLAVIDMAKPWSGVAYRFEEPEFAARDDRLSGLGAKQFGGRWNPIGLAALYGSMTAEAALKEVTSRNKSYYIDYIDALPKTLFAFEAKLFRVLDLTDGRVRQRLRVSLATMTGADWRISRLHKEAVTQAIGRAALIAGFQGLLTPSDQIAKTKNIVVFPDSLRHNNQLQTINPERLG